MGTTQPEEKPGCLSRCSNTIITVLETSFYNIGRLVGRGPWVCLMISLLVATGCSVGMITFQSENRDEKLWVPYGSQSLKDQISSNHLFPPAARENFVLVETINVLTPDVLQFMAHLDQNIKNIAIEEEIWNTICYRAGECVSINLLELWAFDYTTINRLSQEDILNKVNEPNLISPVFFTPVDITSLLGEITRDSNNRIIGAKATLMVYLLKHQYVYDESVGNEVDTVGEAWEAQFLAVVDEAETEGITLYKQAKRSRDDEGSDTVYGDLNLLIAGYGIVVVYVMFFLSKLTLIEQKVYVALAGILTVGLSTISALGLASAIGYVYGPFHPILPFLLLGIGFDDMFVMVATWYNLTDEEKSLNIEKQVASSLRHSGVSITVTSITDFFAFLVGATTIIPALRSFCVYCGIGIILLFLFSITFFLPWLVIDRRRQLSRRDACCCCYRYDEDYKPSNCGQRNFLKEFFYKYYAPVIHKPLIQIAVVVLTFALLGVGIWGTVTWKQDFDSSLFFSPYGNVRQFLAANKKYFPSKGRPTSLFLQNVNYYEERNVLNQLYEDIKGDEWISSTSVSSWYHTYQGWLNTTKAGDAALNSVKWPANETVFYLWLREFLEGQGSTFTGDIVFNNDTSSSQRIHASRINAYHINTKNSAEELATMDNLRAIASDPGFQADGTAFAYSRYYLTYEVNRVIQVELLRNIGLASVCVFVVVFILLSNILQTFLVFCCVVFTLVDLAGTLNFWGITVDTVVAIQLILSIGLSVDSSVHIAYTFMVFSGTKMERSRATLASMGPAVLNGGLSTLLAFLFLAGSTSYIFTTFFKVFFLVVLYGLFHGLVFLPVVMSLIGPNPYISAVMAERPNSAISQSTLETPQLEENATQNESPTVRISAIYNPAFVKKPDTSTVRTQTETVEGPARTRYNPSMAKEDTSLALYGIQPNPQWRIIRSQHKQYTSSLDRTYLPVEQIYLPGFSRNDPVRD